MIPKGYSFAAINVGIKSTAYTGLDLGLISCSTDAVISGVFTRNLVKAAPVIIGMEQVKRGSARAIIANAGNANACTGSIGIADARAMMEAVARELKVKPDEVIPMSTGTIGVHMPTERIIPEIPRLVKGLAKDAESFARSIMTTDTFPKIAQRRVGESSVLGIAKGAGMIAPNMATTLAVVLTDALIDKQELDNIIKNTIGQTFNAITVDGDMSTNDTLLACSSGLVEADPYELRYAMTEVIGELAHMIVRDGEGATKFVTFKVAGASNDRDAKVIAMTVANSLLVKTALFGADPNWGRIMAAVGYAGVNIDPHEISVRIQGLDVVEGGLQARAFTEASLRNALLEKEITIDITVGAGQGRFTAWTTDLSCKYVEINAQYRT
ncbi:MAG: bifunctional glutamate N-acetyltransferase/amino-acid acetyltransferase ArgJ [Desulfobacterota bacterium]|nr:bifunctional glutamate N-acetyltransferase/amino-acid acetyltransferase ArgJ [Thermodesulfobacteriota bacterium]